MIEELPLTEPYVAPAGIDLEEIAEASAQRGDTWEKHKLGTTIRYIPYALTYEGHELFMLEMIFVFGATLRIHGPLGLASVFGLYRARDLGKPTLLYTETSGEQHLSMEWYHEHAEAVGAIDIRTQRNYFDRSEITLEEVERFAKAYLDD